MATSAIILGKGTKVDIALLPLGSKVEPVPATLTVGNTAIAKDITAPATVTIATALATGVVIPAGTSLGFEDPITGKVVVVRLTADADAGDTTLTVASIPEAIAANSVASFPMRLSGRTTANIERTGNRRESFDFDSDGFARGLTASITQNLELQGNYLPGDAGFATAEYAFTNLREVYLWVELPRISDAYTRGKIYKGFASITDLPVEIPADGIMTSSISVAINGELVAVPDVPTPIPAPTP